MSVGTRRSRLALIVLGSTLVLTVAFFGVVALVRGQAGDPLNRLPFYVLGMAAAFVATLVTFEEYDLEGWIVLRGAAIAGVCAFALLALGAEGVRFAATFPRLVFTSDLFLYVLAAGMIATGLGFWALHHWRELTTEGERL